MNGGIARFMNLLWDLIVISVLWLLCSLPVVTLCASTTAAYYAMAKAVRFHAGHVIPEFFSSFRSNLKQALGLGLIYAAVLVILVLDCSIFYGDEAQTSLLFVYLFYLMIALVIASFQYLCPCLSRFGMGSFQLFKLSAGMLSRHLPQTIALLAIPAAAALGVYLMPWSFLVLPGLGFYAETFLMEPLLRKYSPEPEPGSEEADKWYYQ